MNMKYKLTLQTKDQLNAMGYYTQDYILKQLKINSIEDAPYLQLTFNDCIITLDYTIKDLKLLIGIISKVLNIENKNKAEFTLIKDTIIKIVINRNKNCVGLGSRVTNEFILFDCPTKI